MAFNQSQWKNGTFYSEVKHQRYRKKQKGHTRLGIIVNEPTLTNLILNMPYQHFTPNKRSELSALLKAKVKKKDIAKVLRKGRTTIWRERKRAEVNGKYYVSKGNKLAKEKRIKANARFKKIENNEWLREYVVKYLKKYWSPEQIAGRLKYKYPDDRNRHLGKDSIYKYVYGYRTRLWHFRETNLNRKAATK